ncbi:MAG: Fe-S cluster assembly protein SufD, partial [Candidatus Kapabacteria bacterium]|nr:Fe-S cluster assembly protein SufD [Candidatus Kapabacteria bacterium]
IQADFGYIEQNVNGTHNTPLHRLRSNAYKTFETLPFPTVRNEEWKYTNVMQLVGKSYSSQFTASKHQHIADAGIPGIETNIAVMVNGKLDLQNSMLSLPDGVVCMDIHQAYSEHQQLINERLGALVPHDTNAFTASNTACTDSGLFVLIPKGVTVDEPLLILHVIDATEQNMFVQPRLLVIAGENSELTIITRTVTHGTNSSLTNSVIESYAAANARLSMVTLQDDADSASSITTHNLDQKRGSVVNLITVTLSGQIIRNTVGTRLSESGSEAHMYGLYCVGGTTLVDNHTVMDHAMPHCHSNELFKGILADKSQGVFNGKIFVREDAQKTLAYQSNKNILLSESANVNTKPQLEIFADDVKCSHGCTVGQLDEESIFYLRARGLSEQSAKALLLIAFAEDITSQISNEPLRNFINEKIEQRLGIA